MRKKQVKTSSCLSFLYDCDYIFLKERGFKKSDSSYCCDYIKVSVPQWAFLEKVFL